MGFQVQIKAQGGGADARERITVSPDCDASGFLLGQMVGVMIQKSSLGDKIDGDNPRDIITGLLQQLHIDGCLPPAVDAAWASPAPDSPKPERVPVITINCCCGKSLVLTRENQEGKPWEVNICAMQFRCPCGQVINIPNFWESRGSTVGDTSDDTTNEN